MTELRRADLDEDGWELEDAVQQHAENPESFKLPGEHERKHLAVGDVVKLIFLFLDQDERGELVKSERLRVTVRERRAGEYVGTVEDQAKRAELVQRGKQVLFGPEHVAALAGKPR